jgi:cystathionine beta-lyase/cystathionine gamma-synthase
MAALALALVSQLRSGDHIILGSRLYGKTLGLLAEEAARWGLQSTVVDTCDLAATAKAVTPRTKVLLAETITNPLLRVSDIAALAEIAHRRGAVLLIDNTFASPVVCRPVELGADLVMESLTKIMNGHSDVNLGLLCGPASLWERVPNALSTWGLTAAPFDCWLAARGLATLAVRAERACQNALHIARFLQQQRVQAVHYPGLEGHPDHALAARQFGNLFGHVVTFTLPGGQAAAEAFITGAQQVPFCPSLGDVSTTLSHPLSTSHRKLSAQEREAQGIFGGTIRLSIGIESADAIVAAIQKGLAAAERIS